MSQVFKPLTSSGPIPPTIPTAFITDDGTAIPAANILNVNGLDSIENNNNGILTRADPNLSNNLQVILSNRIVITTTTSDGAGQTQIINVLTPPISTGLTFKMRVNGYDSTNNETSGGELVGAGRVSAGGVLVIIGTNDTFLQEDVALNTTNWDVVDNASPILQATFSGIAGRTIDWVALFEYTQSPSP